MLKWLCAAVHLVVIWGVLGVTLFSRNLRHLAAVFWAMVAIRIAYDVHGRCILSTWEGEPTLSSMFASFMLPQGPALTGKQADMLAINLGLVLVAFKLFAEAIWKHSSATTA
jgi:hypothetical protein